MIQKLVSPLALGLVCTALLSGCNSDGNPPTYPVTGTVTLDGEPVEGATVVLVPISADAQGATATTDVSGNFSMTTFVTDDGARPGEYGVKVFKYEIQDPGPTEAQISANPDLTPEEEEELYDPDAEAESTTSKNLLPRKYMSETTSGIKHTVPEEPTTLNIDLE